MSQNKIDFISINLPSETATLKTVVMCFANPVSVSSVLRYGGIDAALLYQLWYNKFNPFINCEKVRRQQQTFMEIMKTNGVEVLLADQVSGCATQHYTRDIGFAIDDTFFCANPRRSYRKRELEGLERLLPTFPKLLALKREQLRGET